MTVWVLTLTSATSARAEGREHHLDRALAQIGVGHQAAGGVGDVEDVDRLGAEPWSARAASELRATGVVMPQSPGPGALRQLTPQELQIVRLAAQGLSNRDIAAQLFLSPRTVGYHLYKAYPKLGVAARSELPGLIYDDP